MVARCERRETLTVCQCGGILAHHPWHDLLYRWALPLRPKDRFPWDQLAWALRWGGAGGEILAKYLIYCQLSSIFIPH